MVNKELQLALGILSGRIGTDALKPSEYELLQIPTGKYSIERSKTLKAAENIVFKSIQSNSIRGNNNATVNSGNFW